MIFDKVVYMENNHHMTIWEAMAQASVISAMDEQIAVALLDEYLASGRVRATCRRMLDLPDMAAIAFYRRLAGLREAVSPVQGQSDSSWMTQADFCYINVRATGLGERPGSFLQAAKLLPALRVNAIHLGPFTLYDFENKYAVYSVRSIDRRLVDSSLEQLGFSAEAQLRAFVQAAHLLGMTVGFDLEPHLAQFSLPAVLHPEMFRWLKLSIDRLSLAGGLSDEVMLTEVVQHQITAEVRTLVARQLEQAGWADAIWEDVLEFAETDPPERRIHKEQVYFGIIGALIAAGYWPVPSQAWSGSGTPGFDGYHFEHNYARFRYLNRDGQDHAAYAFHILTPYKFFDGLLPNQPPEENCLPRPDIQVQEFFYNIFPYWRDRFAFDFVRYDSADHIFDSIWQGRWDVPDADRPTPEILRACIRASKTPMHPQIGNFAERMGLELYEYAALGFDLILGTDMLQLVGRELLEQCFWLHDQLDRLNAGRENSFSVPFCIDTHDTGDPNLWGEPLVKMVGYDGLRLRHFLARFLGCGRARRPKYEVMGMQDRSYGLYQANIQDCNLEWVGDEDFNLAYHCLEDHYARLCSFLQRAHLARRFVEDSFAWWVLQDGEELLVAACAWQEEGMQSIWIEINLDGLVVGNREWKVQELPLAAEMDKVYLEGTRLRFPLQRITGKLFQIFR